MQASEQQRKYGRPAVRHAASAAFLALAIACTAAGPELLARKFY
jgi:hypothetical protein